MDDSNRHVSTQGGDSRGALTLGKKPSCNQGIWEEGKRSLSCRKATTMQLTLFCPQPDQLVEHLGVLSLDFQHHPRWTS